MTIDEIIVFFKGFSPVWAQVIITAIGLAIAIAVPFYVHRKEKTDKRAMDREITRHLVELTMVLAEPARFAILTFCEAVKKQKVGEIFNPREQLLKSSAMRLDQLIVRGFGEPKLTAMLKELVELRKMIDFCFDSLDLYRDHPWDESALKSCMPEGRINRTDKYFLAVKEEGRRVISQLR